MGHLWTEDIITALKDLFVSVETSDSHFGKPAVMRIAAELVNCNPLTKRPNNA
jgi:hypothetical protein